MSQLQSVDEILDFAIAREQEAQEFYNDLAGKMSDPSMAKVFKDFAMQEKGHEAKLNKIKSGGVLKKSGEKVLDLKLADYVVDVQPKEELDYQEALTLAMKREKAAFRLYSNLAERTDDAEIKETFQALAQEESRHKLSIELEYDDKILRDN